MDSASNADLFASEAVKELDQLSRMTDDKLAGLLCTIGNLALCTVLLDESRNRHGDVELVRVGIRGSSGPLAVWSSSQGLDSARPEEVVLLAIDVPISA